MTFLYISQLVLTTDCCNHTQIQKFRNTTYKSTRHSTFKFKESRYPGRGGGGGGGYSAQIKILVDTCRGKVKNGGAPERLERGNAERARA